MALLGSSGVGKSTLVNRLLGRRSRRRGEVREADQRGRHTTTHRELLALPGGALLIDTPGLREIQLWSEGGGLQAAFDDVRELAGRLPLQRLRATQRSRAAPCARRWPTAGSTPRASRATSSCWPSCARSRCATTR